MKSNMSALVEWTDIILGVVSVIITGGLVLFVKNVLRGYRRPNGKKGGIISFHVAVAFAIVASVAMITKDWFLTAATVILAYLIGRGRLDESQHYTYQVVIGAIIGVVIPYGIFYLYYNKINGSSNDYYDREEYDDMPETAHDDRREADEHSELRLEDVE